MKVLIVKEKELEHLHDSLELKMRQALHNAGDDKVKRAMIDEVYRQFNYIIRSWVSQVEKD